MAVKRANNSRDKRNKRDKREGKGKGQEAQPGQGGSALEQVLTPQGFAAGQEFLNKYLQPGFLGRFQGGGPSAEQTEVLAKMKAGLGGYTAPEYQAQREQMQRGLNSNLATSLNQLAKSQARGKVYGAAASAQQANQIRANEENKNALEQDLYVKNIDEMSRRLGEYGGFANNLYGQQAEAQKINLGQEAAEKSSQIESILGLGGLQINKDFQEQMRKIMKQGIKQV